MDKSKPIDIKLLFAQIAEVNKQWFNDLANNEPAPDAKYANLIEMYRQFVDNSQSYLEEQYQFYTQQAQLWQELFSVKLSVANNYQDNQSEVDKRFSDSNWNINPFFTYLKTSYLNLSSHMLKVVAQSDVDKEAKQRLEFFTKQYLDAIAPTNFPFTNPVVIKQALETGGVSLVAGMKHLARDLNNGYMAMTDESKFIVGKNLAVTSGKVVFKNQLIELIHYEASTKEVYSIPFLIVPPCVNKYYILDLQPHNSLVKYLVDSGYSVYLISWKSADIKTAKFDWSNYIELGVIKALEVIAAIDKTQQINTLGYCIGGIILTMAYLVLKKRQVNIINSMVHLTTMLDHANPGDIKFYIDPKLLEFAYSHQDEGGIVSGRSMLQTFSALRANDLIWYYWINNYLLGKLPEPFDILYWNSDTVDLPAKMHRFLLDSLYIKNQLVKGEINICGVILDLREISCPLYLFAAQKDHIVPWHSAYKTTAYVKSDVHFVLGSSGHTSGVINPTGNDKARSYWINNTLNRDPQKWFSGATKYNGSWWQDLTSWLNARSGMMKKAKKSLAGNGYKVLYAAPGKYVEAVSPINRANEK